MKRPGNKPEFEAASLNGATTGKGFVFTWEQYGQFKTFLRMIMKLPGEQWPPPEQWPYFEGLPPYRIELHKPPGADIKFLVIKFIHRQVLIPLNLFDFKAGRRFKFGKYCKDFSPLLREF